MDTRHLTRLKTQEAAAKKLLQESRTAIKTLRAKRQHEERRLRRARQLALGRMADELLGDVDLETMREVCLFLAAVAHNSADLRAWILSQGLAKNGDGHP